MSYKLDVKSDITMQELATILLSATSIQESRIVLLPAAAKRHFVEGADWSLKNGRYTAELATRRLVVRTNDAGKWLWFAYNNTDDSLIVKSVSPHYADSMSAMAAAESAG